MKSRLNVLVIPAWYDLYDPLPGIFIHEYCNALSKKCDITLLNVTIGSIYRVNKEREAINIERKYEVLNVKYNCVIPQKIQKLLPFYDRKSILNKSIRSVLDCQKNKNIVFDIIHIQSVCNNITPLIAQSISNYLRIPYVVTEHYNCFEEAGDKNFIPFLTLNKVKAIVSNAKFRYGVSKFSCDYFNKIFSTSFELIPNIISNSCINYNLKPIVDNNGNFTFLCIGGFHPLKNQTFLLKAFKRLNKKNIKLILIGDNSEYKKEVLDLIDTLNLVKLVEVYGKMSKLEVLSFIDKSNVIISPSLIETFGLTIVEAFYRGKPVIATKSGGPNDLINYDNGELCEINNIEQMSFLMSKMIEDYDRFEPEKIRDNAVSKYSEETIGKLMYNNYLNAINC